MDNPEDEDEDEVEATFEDQVEFFAKEIVLDAHDIAETYKSRPESLRAYFNAHADAEPTGLLGLICGITCYGLATTVSPLTLAITVPASLALIGYCVGRPCVERQGIINAAVQQGKPRPPPLFRIALTAHERLYPTRIAVPS